MAVYKAAFIADMHYYSPKLGTSGRAYELRSGSDQKCLAETGAVFDAVSKKFAESDIDCVCIAGDITNDGEKCSHDEIFEKIKKLDEKKKVFLITSTHDWCSDGNPRRFEGKEVFHDVEAYGPEDIDRMYACFGEKEEIASFTNGMGFHSRVFKLSDELRLIAVNDDCDGNGGRSGYSPEHLAWMCEQIKKAKAENAAVIAMEHHLMLSNISPLINGPQMIADGEQAAAALADAGLRLMFVGHSHMQRTTEFVSPSGNKITQINLGSLTGYPAPITYVTVENGKADIKVEFLDGFEYEGEHYGSDFFVEHTSAVLYNLLNAAAQDKEDLRERLSADGIKIKNYDKLYPIIRAVAKKILDINVGGAARLLNMLTLGNGVDKKDVLPVKDEKLLPHVIDVFLNVFDGSYTSRSQKAEVKNITVSVGKLPSRVVGALPIDKDKKEKILKTTRLIEGITDELMRPSTPDNMDCVIEL